MADNGDRTQAPSERRRLQAREEGQAPLSREVVTAACLAAAALGLSTFGPGLVNDTVIRLGRILADPGLTAQRAVSDSVTAALVAAGPLLLVVLLASGASVLLQTGFLLHAGAAMPDLARLDPRRGLKRVLGRDTLAEALKSLVKLGVLAWAAWTAVRALWPQVPTSLVWTPEHMTRELGHALMHVIVLVLSAQIGIAVLDLAWTRWRFTQRLLMSREELRQETRESDGDPKVKGRIRQIRMARAKRRMMAAVAKATVVVTNPTHYAVALSYERGGRSAPRVVAKGTDEIAARIREAAKAAGVPLVPNPPLARALYTVALDAEIPAEHFKMVAEIIAYVWRLRGLTPARPRA